MNSKPSENITTSDEKEMKFTYERFYQHKYKMAWTKQQVIWFTLAAVTFPLPKLRRTATLAIEYLPLTFDLNTNNFEKFRIFFDTYGTYVVVQADIGGMLWAEDYFETCLIKKMTEKWIRREISKRYWFFYSTKELTETYHKTVDEQYEKNSLSYFKIIGGFPSISPLTAYNWLPTIKSNPTAITYRLQPIYTLLPKGARREALKEATLYLRSNITNILNLYIKCLESETNPSLLPRLICNE
ncbi:hypothetical protein I4U23_016957 [Adineta vaga]|nr:hypothetical protein I4U23_016957 [Adineta vaga]